MEMFKIHPNSFIIRVLFLQLGIEAMQSLIQVLPRKLRIQGFIITLGILLFTTHASTTWANDAEENDALKEQQQKLQQILDEIGDAREQRTEQRALLEKLNQKMQCNWTLIQDYDTCDKKHKEQKQGQLNCTQQAKERAKECLSNIDN